MKKVSLAALSIVALTSTAAMAADAPCPMAFKGFSFGGTIGYDVVVGTEKLHVDDNLIHKNKAGGQGVIGGLTTGYLHRMPGSNYAFGIGFDAVWANTSGRLNNNDVHYHKVRLKNALQLYGKLGYVICEKTMPFIALGWENAQWSQNLRNVSTDPVEHFSKKKRLNGFMWRAGVDFLATRHVVLGFEYTGSTTSKHNFTKTAEDGSVYRAKFKPQHNTFALTARVVY